MTRLRKIQRAVMISALLAGGLLFLVISLSWGPQPSKTYTLVVQSIGIVAFGWVGMSLLALIILSRMKE